MGDLEDFHRDFLPRFIDAQRAFHNGDPEPNLALWSTADPVTLFAARGLVDAGSERVTKARLRSPTQSFSRWVDGNFAYTVAIERYTASAGGAPPTQTERRATHVYRREDGHWRAVHRHADRRPPDRAAN